MKNVRVSLMSVILLLAFFDTSAGGNVWGQRRSFRQANMIQYDHRLYHFGFLLGLNRMDFGLRTIENFDDLQLGNFTEPTPEFDTLYSVFTRPWTGFNIGIVSNLKLTPHLDLRFIPTLSFGDRSIIYNGFKNNSPITRTQQIESTFLDFPLHIKFKSSRMTNTRVFVTGGIKYSYDLASAQDREDDQEEELLARIKASDFYYELGAGFDHYFFFFRFSAEIKASFGLRDMIVRDNTMFSNAIDRLNSKIVMVSFTFE